METKKIKVAGDLVELIRCETYHELSEVSCRYGAPMGRRNIREVDPGCAVQFHLRRVPFVDSCYDRGGAYWGGPANLWRAYHCSEEGVVEIFVRARSREEAKEQVKEDYMYAVFYR